MSARLQPAVAALLVGLMAVALAISAATVIFHGPLAAHLALGIALVLAGGMVMALVSARLERAGGLCQPQASIAVILALQSAAIVAGLPDPGSERGFATTAVFVAAATLATGGAAWLLGRARLGGFVRFIPFPVVAGFLAATGYLMVVGALATMVGWPVGLWSLGVLLESGNPARWAPWSAAALAIAVTMRWTGRPFVLPAGLALAGLGFYLALPALGLDLADARAAGLLLGPFDGGFAAAVAGWRPLAIDWPLLVRGLPTLAVAAGLAIFGALLTASSLEVVTGERQGLVADAAPDQPRRQVGDAGGPQRPVWIDALAGDDLERAGGQQRPEDR